MSHASKRREQIPITSGISGVPKTLGPDCTPPSTVKAPAYSVGKPKIWDHAHFLSEIL